MDRVVDDSSIVSRRELLGASVAFGAKVPSSRTSTKPTDARLLERVRLGKTGLKVTRLTMGGSFSSYGPRILEFTYRSGINCFDNGDFYAGFKAETLCGEWVNKTRRRDDVVIINKARTIDPDKFVARLDEALDKMKLKTIDIFMLHNLSDPNVVLDRSKQWRKLKDRLIREKKIRFMGFSVHDPDIGVRIACLNNAAKSGWIDMIMPACDIGMIRRNTKLNKALDVCAKADIGLIAIKVMRGLGKASNRPKKTREAFKPLGMSPHVAMLASMWSDGRFASICTEMPSRKIIEENCGAARTFKKPFDGRQWQLLEKGMKKLTRSTCPGCEGACVMTAGTQTDFCSIARYLAYYEEDGKYEEARKLYYQLPLNRRRWHGKDLKAASRACPAGLDFEAILDQAGRVFGA
ncbi:MAG: aldo/keto reductase [Planctomycetota bacterium]|jgi:predicted aldo/keto reductase-like oxidoreductase